MGTNAFAATAVEFNAGRTCLERVPAALEFRFTHTGGELVTIQEIGIRSSYIEVPATAFDPVVLSAGEPSTFYVQVIPRTIGSVLADVVVTARVGESSLVLRGRLLLNVLKPVESLAGVTVRFEQVFQGNVSASAIESGKGVAERFGGGTNELLRQTSEARWVGIAMRADEALTRAAATRVSSSAGALPARAAAAGVKVRELLEKDGILVGRYQLVGKLPSSATWKESWKAFDRWEKTPVVVRVPADGHAPPIPAFNRVKHRSILKAWADGRPGAEYLVGEAPEGRTLSELRCAAPAQRLALEAVLPLAQQVADALDHAHARSPGVFHGGLDPAGVWVCRDGSVRVTDALLNPSAEAARPPTQTAPRQSWYAAPEQSTRATAAGDVYSLAAVVYECLTGATPLTPADGSPVPWCELPQAVYQALAAGLARDPAARPASARQWVDALRLAGREAPTPAAATELPLIDSAAAAEAAQHECAHRLGVPVRLESRAGFTLQLVPAGCTRRASASVAGVPRHPAAERPFFAASFPLTHEGVSTFLQAAAASGASPERARLFKDRGFAGATRAGLSDLAAAAALISFADAEVICGWLGELDGRRYRVPTEVEWDYLTATAGMWGLRVPPPGVVEWTASEYRPVPGPPSAESVAAARGGSRVVCGSARRSAHVACRAADLCLRVVSEVDGEP